MLPYRLLWKSLASGESDLVADQTRGLTATSQFALDLINTTGSGRSLSLRSRNRAVRATVLATHNRSTVGAALMTLGSSGGRFSPGRLPARRCTDHCGSDREPALDRTDPL